MKKDLFNNNIKPQFVSKVWCIVIVEMVLCGGMGTFLILLALGKIENELTNETLLVNFILGVFFAVFGIVRVILTFVVIRTYPKSKGMVRFVFNSDCYFVGVEEPDYYNDYGRRHDAYFHEFIRLSEDINKRVDKSLFPKRMWVYMWIGVAGVVLFGVNVVITAIIMNNMVDFEYYENTIMSIFIVVEIFLLIISLFFIFKAKKIRMDILADTYLEDDEYER